MDTGRFLLKRYDMWGWLLNVCYVQCPFLFEIGAMLDWTFTYTTLVFVDWFKFESIIYNLYECMLLSGLLFGLVECLFEALIPKIVLFS